MKKLILFFIVLLLAVWLGITMHQHPGYVLISVAHTQIETTLWFALIAVLVAFFILKLVIGLLHGIWQIPHRYQGWSALHREHKSYQLFQQGVCQLLQAQWDKAENTLKTAIKKQPSFLITYLAAAKAAHMQQAYTRRDDYLQQAKQIAQKAELLPLSIVEVAWQLESNQLQPALATLSQLKKTGSTHPVLLRELKNVYFAEGDWEKLRELLPKLQHHHVFNTETLQTMEREIYMALLQQAANTDNANADTLEKVWRQIPKKLQKDPALIASYAHYLLQFHQDEQVEDLLKHPLRKSLDTQLLACYAQLSSADPAKQLARAEQWLNANPHNADLLYCLGQLCAQHRLWGKARSYLEKSIQENPRTEVYRLLGHVMENLGDTQQALQCYRNALSAHR